MPEQDDMTELVEKRTRMTKTFQKGPGQFALVSNPEGFPLHTKKDGKWEDYDFSIESGRVACADYDVRILNDAIGYEGTDPQGRHIRLELEGKWSKPELHENMATWLNVAPGVDFCLAFDIDRIRAVRVLHHEESERKAVYWHERDKKAQGGLLNVGNDLHDRPAEIKVEEDLRGENSRKITQTFTGRVLEIDELTRERSWSDDPTYPVLVDPTSTFDLGDTNVGTGNYNHVIRGIFQTIDRSGATNSVGTENLDSGSGISTVTTSSLNAYAMRAFNLTQQQTSVSTTYSTSYIPNSTSPTTTIVNTNYNTFNVYTTKQFYNGVKMLFPVSGIPQTATINSATLTCEFMYQNYYGNNRNIVRVRGLIMEGKDPQQNWTGETVVGTGDDSGKSIFLKNWCIPSSTVGGTTSVQSAIDIGDITLNTISTATEPGGSNTWLEDSISCTSFVANRVNNYDYETEGGHLAFNFKMGTTTSPSSLGSTPAWSAIIRPASHANGPQLVIEYTTGPAAIADVPSIVFA